MAVRVILGIRTLCGFTAILITQACSTAPSAGGGKRAPTEAERKAIEAGQRDARNKCDAFVTQLRSRGIALEDVEQSLVPSGWHLACRLGTVPQNVNVAFVVRMDPSLMNFFSWDLPAVTQNPEPIEKTVRRKGDLVLYLWHRPTTDPQVAKMKDQIIAAWEAFDVKQ